MINNTDNPIEFAALSFELTDAAEHLQDLITQLGEYLNETDFTIQLGHIYEHLNRAWNTRNRDGKISLDYDKEWDTISAMPTDLPICG